MQSPLIAAALTVMLQAQTVAQGASQSFSTEISCSAAADLLVARAEGLPRTHPVFSISRRDQADLALRALTELAADRPACPAAFGVRGLVKWSIADSGWVPRDAPGQRAGVAWPEDAVYDLEEASKRRGPAGAAASVIGVRLLLADGAELPWLLKEVGPSLLAALADSSGVSVPVQQLARGRLAAWLWEPGIADSAFAAYAAAGGSAARADFERARVGFVLGRQEAAVRYYRAAAGDDSTVAAELRTDLALLASADELADFDATSGEARADWLRQFWESRDAEALRERGSRLPEHYRRIAFAKQHFRLLVYPRRYELNEKWVNPGAEFDDRGLLYVRHGAPDDTASIVQPGTCPNVSWKYVRAEGNLIFHFVARENPNDWRLVETLANVSGERGATTTVRRAGDIHSCNPVNGLLESRQDLDPVYARLAVAPSQRSWEAELDLVTRSRETGITTDSDELRFGSVIESAWHAYGLFGTNGGVGRVLLITSVGTDALVSVLPNRHAYLFRTHTVLIQGKTIVETDSVRRLALREAPQAGQMLSFTDEIAATPGVWRVGMVLTQPADSAGQFYRDGDVRVPEGRDGIAAVSDIVLGAARGGLAWQAPDGSFPLSATGSYAKGEPVPIYYEVVPPQAGELTTTVAFRRESDRNPTEFRFTERVRPGINYVRRELDTARLKSGRYELTLTVGSDNGSSTERHASLYVRDR